VSAPEEPVRRLVAQLEQATARLEGLSPDDLEGIAAAIRERSEAILALRELVAQIPPAAVSSDLLERLRNQRAASGSIARKLLVLRAAARAELMRVLEAGFLTRSLARRGGRAPHIDCRG
jgi:hypothetical protein